MAWHGDMRKSTSRTDVSPPKSTDWSLELYRDACDIVRVASYGPMVVVRVLPNHLQQYGSTPPTEEPIFHLYNTLLAAAARGSASVPLTEPGGVLRMSSQLARAFSSVTPTARASAEGASNSRNVRVLTKRGRR